MKIDHKNDFWTDLGAEKNVISKTVQNWSILFTKEYAKPKTVPMLAWRYNKIKY